MTEIGRRPPERGLYPTVTLGDGRWESIIRILRAHGTKTGDRLADQVDQQVQNTRDRTALIEDHIRKANS